MSICCTLYLVTSSLKLYEYGLTLEHFNTEVAISDIHRSALDCKLCVILFM